MPPHINNKYPSVEFASREVLVQIGSILLLRSPKNAKLIMNLCYVIREILIKYIGQTDKTGNNV